jgi:uncharacterized protein (DUF1330 family)
MPVERTIGLLVVDHDKYAEYRAEMTPILERTGGRFRYDFEVARTLKSEGAKDINRVFVLRFPDGAARDRFFADPVYREIRARLFDKAVASVTTIADYTVDT